MKRKKVVHMSRIAQRESAGIHNPADHWNLEATESGIHNPVNHLNLESTESVIYNPVNHWNL